MDAKDLQNHRPVTAQECLGFGVYACLFIEDFEAWTP